MVEYNDEVDILLAFLQVLYISKIYLFDFVLVDVVLYSGLLFN
jgi:hypothetical protein